MHAQLQGGHVTEEWKVTPDYASLCAIPIQAMLAMELPPKTLTAMAKICCGFLWCGKDDANGRSCVVA